MQKIACRSLNIMYLSPGTRFSLGTLICRLQPLDYGSHALPATDAQGS